MFRNIIRCSLATLTATLLMSQAHAATFTLNLSGDTSQFTEFTFNSSGNPADAFYLSLTGFGAPITVSNGDIIDSTVTLNNEITIPSASNRTDYILSLDGPPFPDAGDNGGVFGEFKFYDNGTLVRTLDYGTSTSSRGLAGIDDEFAPNNTPITFNSFTNDLTIDILPGPTLLDSGAFQYDLVEQVPEPATWAMFLVGFGAIGFGLRMAGRGKAVVA
jgi:hypothetical protein